MFKRLVAVEISIDGKSFRRRPFAFRFRLLVFPEERPLARGSCQPINEQARRSRLIFHCINIHPHLVQNSVSEINMSSSWWMTGCLSGASAVMLGAFGAHGLKSRISEPARLDNWKTAAQYQVCPSTYRSETHPLGLGSNPRLVDPLRGLASSRTSRAEKHLGEEPLHRGHDHVQR